MESGTVYGSTTDADDEGGIALPSGVSWGAAHDGPRRKIDLSPGPRPKGLWWPELVVAEDWDHARRC